MVTRKNRHPGCEMTIKLLIADDHKLIRDGLTALIARCPDIDVVGEAGEGRTALQLVRELNPDIVIMDVSMPELNGYEATRQIVNEFPNVKVLALSMYSDRRFVIEMLKAGASGYMLKDCAFEELIKAIKAVVSGRTYLNPSITKDFVDDYITHSKNKAESELSLLSDREREVLQLLSEGHSTKEIASRISLSAKTIETHRKRIMDKLDLRSIAQLTKFAVREGLTSLE